MPESTGFATAVKLQTPSIKLQRNLKHQDARSPEGRNPKAEGNPKSEIRRPKAENLVLRFEPDPFPLTLPSPLVEGTNQDDPRLVLRASDFGILSDFGIRVSDLRAYFAFSAAAATR